MAADERILRRRAQFMSAALLLVTGCTEKPSHEVAAVPSTEHKPVVPPPPAPVPPGPIAPPKPRPPLTAKVSAARQKDLDAEIVFIEGMFVRVEALSRILPASCDVADEACRARWRTVAEKLEQLHEDLYELHRYACPPKDPDGKAIRDMTYEQKRWLYGWLEAIQSAGNRVLAQHSDAGRLFDALCTEERRKHPQACLSISCPK